MSILDKLFRSLTHTDAVRADLFMEYHPLTSTGTAAIEWVYLQSNDSNLRAALVALLYSRILGAHAETRVKLFQLVDMISKQNVRDEGQTGFLFPEWKLQVGFGAPEQRIWPWVLVDNPHVLTKPKVYSATLQGFPRIGQFGIKLKMAFGQERILAPAAALMAITSYAESTDQEGRYELAVLLWQINEYYGSPTGVHVGRE